MPERGGENDEEKPNRKHLNIISLWFRFQRQIAARAGLHTNESAMMVLSPAAMIAETLQQSTVRKRGYQAKQVARNVEYGI